MSVLKTIHIKTIVWGIMGITTVYTNGKYDWKIVKAYLLKIF